MLSKMHEVFWIGVMMFIASPFILCGIVFGPPPENYYCDKYDDRPYVDPYDVR